ncbi:MAG: SDR family NAD(P)-dependent oxidoreductase [Balneolaceae bacterium]
MSKKIIIIGATSGIGEELARQCVEKGYHVGGTGRRVDRLTDLKKELGNYFSFVEMDVTRHQEAKEQLHELIRQLGGMDIIVLNAGISSYPATRITEMDQKIIDINVSGFVQLFGESYNYFRNQGDGHIVGVSSIASFFGAAQAAPYCASKAFISTYMQGYRQRSISSGHNIVISDIKPGFVKSEMTQGKKGMFWVAETKTAVRQMVKDIEKERSYSYVTRRWRLVAWLIKLTPNWLLERVNPAV